MKILILIFILALPLSLTANDFVVDVEGVYGNIVGEEYWVFDDDKNGSPYQRTCDIPLENGEDHYYKEVIWSYDEWSALGTNQYTPPYYPLNCRKEIPESKNKIKNESKECVMKGHQRLKRWLMQEDSIISKYLKLIKDLGGTTDFYFWANDYQTENAIYKSKRPRRASVWNYEDIFLKFEIVILPNGTCLIPKKEGVIETLDLIAHHFEDKRKKDLNFVQRIFDVGRGKDFKKTIYEIREGIPNGQNDGSLAQ